MSSNQGKIPNYINFLFGGSAGMGATLFVQPLDLVKNRMQMSGEGGKQKLYRNSFHAISEITKKEGITGIYTGLSAGLLRQATYTTVRLGVYNSLFQLYTSKEGPPNFVQKIGISVVAGLVGSFVGTPTEVSLVRMTSDGRLPPAERRGYKNVFNAIFRIAREEGVLSLWRGCIPTMARAAVVNAAQLTSYSQAKEVLLQKKLLQDGLLCHFTASMISGLVTTAASLPVDIIKTRLQNMRVINGKPEYNGIFDILSRTVRQEGVLSLWKGFTPYYLRLGPHTVITFVFLEQMNKFYRANFLTTPAAK